MLSETEDHKKQHLATLKRLKRGDENELERSLRLEKVVASKQLRLVVETEEERRARLDNDAATKWLSLAMQMDEERKARLEKMVTTKRLRLAMEMDEQRTNKEQQDWRDGSYHTAQLDPGNRGERRAKNVFGLRLEFSKIQGMSSLALFWEQFF